MKIRQGVFVLCLSSVPLWAGVSPKKFQPYFDQECYLKLYEKLKTEKEAGGWTAEHEKAWTRLMSYANESVELGMVATYYRRAFSSWVQHDALGANASWAKYLEMRRRLGEGGMTAQASEVEEYFKRTKPVPPEVLVLTEEDFVEVASPSPSPSRRRASRKKSRPERIDPAISVNELLTKGAEAERMGRFEKARDLYKTALKLEPTNEEAQKKVDDLRRRMD